MKNVLLIERKMELLSSSEMNFPKSGIFTNYCVGRVGQINF